MCSVTGLIDFAIPTGEFRSESLDEKVRAMLDSTRHRGPDGEGVYSRGNFALGHRRLAIVGSAADGAQPLLRAGCALSFNGMIYNHRELRHELRERHGARFEGECDSEVVLEAYLAWGPGFEAKLRGMWALAILDFRGDGELYLSRDRFGIKPLYTCARDRRFFFASEIPAILAAWEPGWKRAVDLSVLADFLVTGSLDHRDETFFEGIRRFPPGSNARLPLRGGILQADRYFDLVEREGPETGNYLASLEEAVASHAEAAHEVGLGLSGGLDSSAIAALARKRGLRVAALTVGSSDPRIDERRWAELASRGLSWASFVPGPDAILEVLPEVARHQAEPTGTSSSALQFLLMREARTRGMKVMLDGQGGDETLLGYGRYLSYAPRWVDWPRAAYFRSRRLRQAKLALRLRGFRAHFQSLALRALRAVELPARDLRSLQKRELTRNGQLAHLLRIADRSSMAHGIEARFPFLDHPVVEAALGLPTEQKVRKGVTKVALRSGLRGLLPEELLWRTDKVGFEAQALPWSDERSKQVSDSPLLRAIYREPPRTYRSLELAYWERELGVFV